MSVKGNVAYHLIRLVLAGVFVYASIDKILHPQAFAQAVFNHQVLPGAMINSIAIVLPWMELVLGGCLLSNRWMCGASLWTAGLMMVFMGLILFNLSRGLDVGCGCFSTSEDSGMDTMTLVRDMIFLMLSLALVALTVRKHRQTCIHGDVGS